VISTISIWEKLINEIKKRNEENLIFNFMALRHHDEIPQSK
jgi:hypothetical protein